MTQRDVPIGRWALLTVLVVSLAATSCGEMNSDTTGNPTGSIGSPVPPSRPGGATSEGAANPATRTSQSHRPLTKANAAGPMRPQQVDVVTPLVAYVVAVDRHRAPWLYRTTDAGAQFGKATSLPDSNQKGRSSRRPPRIVFTDARHGYAISGAKWPAHQVWRTNDAGLAWHRTTIAVGLRGVVTLGGHGRRAFAVTLRPGRCACRTDLYTRSDRGAWRHVAALPERKAESGVGMTAWGNSIWLTLGVGSSRHPVGLYSTDGGHTFTRVTPLNAVSCWLTATSSDTAWTSCSTGMLEAFFRLHPRELEPLPVGGSGTGNTGLDPLTNQVAIFATQFGDNAGISTTVNGGRTFTKVAGFPRLGRRGSSVGLSFFSLRHGLGLVADGRLFETSDGGHTWRPISLSQGTRRSAGGARPCRPADVAPHFRREGEGATGHYAHLLDIRNVSNIRCVLSGSPLRVSLSQPGHATVVARKGGFFDATMTPSAPLQPGQVTTLVIETDTYCPARPTGGSLGPVYRHVSVALMGGDVRVSTSAARGLDVGCGAFATKFGRWE